MRRKLAPGRWSDSVPCTETVLSRRGYVGAVTQVERNGRAPSRETAYRTAYQASFRRRHGETAA